VELEEIIVAFPIDSYTKSDRKRMIDEMSATVSGYSYFTAKKRNLGRLLIVATNTYPQLDALYQKHIEFNIDSILVFLVKAGSKWDESRMRELGRYLFAVRQTIYHVPNDIAEESVLLREIALIALIKESLL